MVYECFLDDSKDQTQSQMIISAGYFGTRAAWGRLRTSWKSLLRVEGLDYFKTSEYKMLQGQFAKFSTDAFPPPSGRQEATRIRSGFLNILENNPDIAGIAIGIPVEDYWKVSARPESQDFFAAADPYRRALEGVLLETIKAISQIPGKHVVAFVHDNGPNYDQLRKYYDEFKELNPKTARNMGGFQPLNDEEHPPLQLADMIANRCLEVGMKWLADNQNASIQKEMNMHHFGAWTEHYMLSIVKRNMKRLGRTIPLDLQPDEYG